VQHFRKIRTMQEDFESLGIAKARAGHGLVNERNYAPISEDIEPLRFDEHAQTEDLDGGLTEDVDLDDGFGDLTEDMDLDDLLEGKSKKESGCDDDDDYDDDEDDDEDDDDIEESENMTEEELAEGLIKKRLKRMKAGDRAKARQNYRKKKKTILRKRHKREKKAKTKIRHKRITALRGNKKAGSRRRFQLKNDIHECQDLNESLEGLDLSRGWDLFEEVERGFGLVDQFSGVLVRKFAVAEEALRGLEEGSIPVEHPDSEFGYDEEPENTKKGGKTGDATDSAGDAPKGNVKSNDDHPDHKTPKGNVKFEADGDDEDDDDEDDEDEEKNESIDMPSEMVMLRLEAQDALDKMKTHVISPSEAGSILRDMVTYLGGAMKTYMDLASGISKYAYAGIGAPGDYGVSVKDNTDQTGHNYIGKDDLGAEKPGPSQYTQRT